MAFITPKEGVRGFCFVILPIRSVHFLEGIFIKAVAISSLFVYVASSAKGVPMYFSQLLFYLAFPVSILPVLFGPFDTQKKKPAKHALVILIGCLYIVTTASFSVAVYIQIKHPHEKSHILRVLKNQLNVSTTH